MSEKRQQHSNAPFILHESPRRRSFGKILAAGAASIVLLLCLPYFDINLFRPTSWMSPSNLSIEDRALEVLKENPLIDGHNDLLWFIRTNYRNHIYNKTFRNKFEHGGLELQVDIPRLAAGHSSGAFWSAFTPCPSNITDFSTPNYASTVRATLEQIDLYNRLSTQYPHYFTPTLSSAAAHSAFLQKTFIAPLAIEGLHQIGNSLSTLRLYHTLGIRYATLTWNCHNAFADAALLTTPAGTIAAAPFWHGVSPAGRNVIHEMNRLGMIVDLSHTSTETMRDVLRGRDGEDAWEGSLAPPVFSHSSVYALCPHPRNVPDDVLALVRRRRGVVMVNVAPEFIACRAGNDSSGLPVLDEEHVTLRQVVRHVMYIGERIGWDYVGIGTDFDGIARGPRGFEDVGRFPDLVAELLRRGVSEKDAGKVVGRNLLRVWGEVDAVAKRLQKTMRPIEDDLEAVAAQTLGLSL